MFGVRAAQALAGLHATDAQDQCRRPLGFLQAPAEAGRIQQNQPGGCRQLAGWWQLPQGAETHLILGSALDQLSGKGANRVAVLHGRQ
ncbi:hypothetical protein D3C75_971710 [compost metagenome]